MAITPHPIDTTIFASFNEALRKFLTPIEGDVPFVYSDQPAGVPGVPTLGVGYALLAGTPGMHDWALRDGYRNDLSDAGILLTDAQLQDLEANLTEAMNALNGVAGAVNPFFPAADGVNPLGWTIETTQSQSLFDLLVPEYETRVRNWLGNDAVYSSLQGSQEMIALYSMSFNGLIKVGKFAILRDAVISGTPDARAEAWYEIRYHHADQLWYRRYEEAALFGLYNDKNNITLDSAKAAYQMFNLHRDKILSFGRDRTSDLAMANRFLQRSGFTSVSAPTIQEALNPAKPLILADLLVQNPANTQLLNRLVADMDVGPSNDKFLSTNIYLDPGRELPDPGQTLGAINPDNNGALLSATPDTAVDEIFIGEGGNDYLFAGKGNDVLVGGAGLDTYIYRMGDGNDLIADSDSQGRIVVYEADGKTALTVAAGAFTETAAGSNTWTSADGKLTLKHGTTWMLDIQGDGAIDLGDNFTSGDFGIRLANAPEQTTRDIYGDPVMHYAKGIVPRSEDPSWHVTYITGRNIVDGVMVSYDIEYFIVDGNGNPAETGGPAFGDTLYGGGSNDHIASGGGIDHIYAAQGGNDFIEAGGGNGAGASGTEVYFSDYVEAGAGDDRIYANSFVDTATAIAEGNTQASQEIYGLTALGGDGNDVMVGSAGNDYLAGGTGSDLLIGGAGNDVIEGNNDADALPSWQGYSYDDYLGFCADNAYFFLTPDFFQYEAPNFDASGDVIYAGAGSDYAIGNNGNDVIYGEDGNDALVGYGGNDVILGGNNDDIIYGDVAWGYDYTNLDGSDYLDGGAGIDQIYGNGGDDILVGGAENDRLFGGVGQDTYIFNAGDGIDNVYDTRGENNVIRFGAGVDKNNIHLHLGSLMLDLGNGDAIHINNEDQSNANGFDRNDVFNSSSIRIDQRGQHRN